MPSAEEWEWLEMKVKNMPCAACAKRGNRLLDVNEGKSIMRILPTRVQEKVWFFGQPRAPDGYGFGHFLFMLWNNWKHCKGELRDVKEQLQETKHQLSVSNSNRNEIMENYDAMEAGLIEAGFTKKNRLRIGK